jgi:hypothetical protein
MLEVASCTRNRVKLNNGVEIRQRQPISAAEIHHGVVVVLSAWISGRREARQRTLRRDNVYGYDFSGRRLWRVGASDRGMRGLYYTAFVDDGPSVTFHVASGWHVVLDPLTGRIAQADCVS